MKKKRMTEISRIMKRCTEPKFRKGESLESWLDRQINDITKNWSSETWKILGIARDLQDSITPKKVKQILGKHEEV